MPDISHHQFITLLKRSNVVEPKKLQPWLAQTKKNESARKLAKSLVQNEMLTTWQAKFLLSGRHRLRIGNYFLLSRLRRDELGARYLGVHSKLRRKVELQIFARDLTSDTQRWKDMIKKASLVAKLDHPALVHVYDIDHDDDRYFLVVEHIAGRPLDVQKEIFTTPQIGKLILQCVEGIEVAHQNQVVHGTIDQTDVLLTDKGTVKLQNLTVSPMRSSNSGGPEAEPVADYLALAVLGEKVLEANPGAEDGPGIGLSAIFEMMKLDGPKAVKKLKRWVEVTPDASAVSVATTSSGANPIFSPTHASSSNVDLKTKVASSSIDLAESDESATSSSASIVEAARSSRPFLIAIAIGLVLLLGIVVFGLSRAYHKFVVEPAAVAAAEKEELEAKNRVKHDAKEQKKFDALQNEADKNKDATLENNPAGQQSKNQDTDRANQAKSFTDDAGHASVESAKSNDPQPGEAELSKVEPADEDRGQAEETAEPNKFLDIFGKRKTETSAKAGDAEASGGELGIPPMVTDEDNLQKLTGIARVTEKVLKNAGVKTHDQIEKMTPAQLDKVLEEGGTNKFGEAKWKRIIEEAKPLAEVSRSKSANPFRRVPEEFELPAIDSSASLELTDLKIPANYSLTTELISPDGISPRRVFFELRKSSTGDQTWTVVAKKTKTASKTNDIATFTHNGNAFNFAWLPAAAKDKSAVYLRNCLLRLSTPDGQSSISKLRKPITTIRSLRITEDKLFDTVKLEVDGVPDFDRVQIQLGPLRNPERSVEVLDPSCTLDSPAVVALKSRETKDGFLSLQVFVARSGGIVKLTAGLVFNGRMLKSKKDLVAIQNRLASDVATAKRQTNLNADDREKLVNAAERNLTRMNDYMESIEWLFKGGGGVGEPINYDVTADFGDDGRIILVKSDKNKVNDDKRKNSK